jgi:CBS domain containing-hemolysin-like protein
VLLVALWVALVLALAVIALTIVAAAMKRELNEFSRNESLGFLRLLLVGSFGIVVSESLAPLALRWYWSGSISLESMIVLLFGSQLIARSVSHKRFGTWLATKSKRFVKSLDMAFSPIASKAEEAPEEFEQELIESVEDFGETIVREIMVPRIDVQSVSAGDTLDEALKSFLNTGFSRLPVRGKNIDDIKGVLYLKDVARRFASLSTLKVSDLTRNAMFVPDSKPVEDLLKQMQLAATHVAIVVDEYGGVAGLVTMEDVIEELVGEITDEYDNERPDIEVLAADQLRVSAKSSLFELGEHLELELEDDDIDSVGGLVTKLLGRLPRGGDQVHYSGLTFAAERFEGRNKRLVSVLVKVDPAVVAMKEETNE